MSAELDIILLICFLWGVTEIAGQLLARRLRSRIEVKTSDRGSRNVIWLSFFFFIFISIFFAENGIAPIPDLFFYVGIAVMLIGILLRQWAIHVLGKFFSTKVSIIKSHRIVKDGPYSIIRHPSYTGGLLIIIGLGLAMRTWAGTLLIIILSGVAYYYRINLEEKALRAEFGKEYEEYAKKTKRLIPYVF